MYHGTSIKRLDHDRKCWQWKADNMQKCWKSLDSKEGKRSSVRIRTSCLCGITLRVSDLKLPLLTSGHSQSVAVGASVFCQLTAVFVAPFLNLQISFSCMHDLPPLFFQFHILGQWSIAFHVMWEEKGSSACLVSDMMCHLSFFVWLLKQRVCQS